MDLDDFNDLLPFENGMFQYQYEYCQIIDQDHENGENTTIILPTGMGKTVALYRVFHNAKTIYTVPIRALADEKLLEIPQMFPNTRLLRDTGADREQREDFDYINQDLIITTTERLLSIMNNSIRDDVLKNVEYIVFDEVHLISDINRGSAVEWVIMMLKREYPHIHLIGLTATLNNHQEFGEWFGGTVYYKPASERPIPLEFVYGQPTPDFKKMDQVRDFKFGQLVRWSYTYKEPTLVFIASKPAIEKYARKFAGVGENATLEEVMQKGVAFHHRDINEDMKGKVIEQFIDGKITHVFCSPTLAMGVNVPATNCMIFDISFWNDKAWEHEPLEEAKLTQMFGRAGRQGYSDVGRVIFAGKPNELAHAKWCIDNPQPSNSQFGRIIVDKILAMIVRKDAKNIDEIYDVMKHSFLFHQNPNFDRSIISNAVDTLKQNKFIVELGNGVYKPTNRGTMTVKLYISVHTIVDTLSRLSEYRKNPSKTLFDMYRIFLGNDEFLSTVPYNEKKDTKFVNGTERYWSKSNNTWKNLFVQSYDKDQNKHVIEQKSENLKKVLALIFKDEVMGKKFRSLTSGSTLARWRADGSGLISRLSTILKTELQVITDDKRLFDLTEKTLKYGTLNEQTIELFDIEGFGDTTVSRLINAGIKDRKQLFSRSLESLKRHNVKISPQRWEKLRVKYGGYKPAPKLSDWEDW
jgi:replicative superfamily II helicase